MVVLSRAARFPALAVPEPCLAEEMPRWTLGPSHLEVLNRGDFAPLGIFGNVWGHFFFFCHNWAAATGFFGVAVRDTAKHPAMHRAAPTTQKYPAPNLSGAEVEKCCPTSASEQHLYMRYRYMFFFFF